MRTVTVIAALLVSLIRPATVTAQACDEPHYRWSEKTALTLAGLTPTHTTINQMLTSWGVPAIYGAADECKARAGRELHTYWLYGWIRRRKVETDGDWHIEVTPAKTGTVTNHCIVVEIPPPSAGPQFRIARDQVDALIAAGGGSVSSAGDLSKPVRVKIVGAAFFDGEHRGARGTSNPPHQHGRCNRDSRSLWEIHPVYGAFAP